MSESIDTIPAKAERRFGPSPWPWMALACAIIAASGAVRVGQEHQFADAARSVSAAPFPMRDLPPRLGTSWEMVGGERYLEEQTQQIAGCSDYMYRQYVDKNIGDTLGVLVAFGPAERIFPHSPLACFPANGYEPRGGPWARTIDLGEGGQAADFSALAYSKAGGGVEEVVEVYYSFRHDDRWSPDARRSQFRHRPAMFKIQVERPIASGEVGGEGSPIEDFLAALVPEIERRLDAVGHRSAE